MSACIVYSSNTGNTRYLALALASNLALPVRSVAEAKAPDFDLLSYDCLFLGFWVKKGLPDPEMLAYLKNIEKHKVFFFCTHAAWPDSEHVQKCKARVRELLQAKQNQVLGCFTCQGGLKRAGGDLPKHPLTPERRARLEEAAKHPNALDCASLIQSSRKCLGLV
ncbi:MAG: flavodoxin [Desulfovibrio sp.]|nr:flavodoxin [Desulfovibrio sp.]